MSFLFEVAASRLIDCSQTFDGITGVVFRIRKQRQIVFTGKMWTLQDGKDAGDLLEPFEAIVTDKRITNQGLWIKIQVGECYGEGDLLIVL